MEFIIFTFLAAIIATLLITFFQKERLFISDGRLILKHQGNSEALIIKELTAINFHYQEGSEHSGIWEFTASTGKSIKVDKHAKGVSYVLECLEKKLHQFNLDSFDKTFEARELEDHITVWEKV